MLKNKEIYLNNILLSFIGIIVENGISSFVKNGHVLLDLRSITLYTLVLC